MPDIRDKTIGQILETERFPRTLMLVSALVWIGLIVGAIAGVTIALFPILGNASGPVAFVLVLLLSALYCDITDKRRRK
jgi:uncharacterized membrane protein YoaK (UPF0700 family)